MASQRIIGTVSIVHGAVKAVSSAGVERILVVGGPVFVGERIVTGADGVVSIAWLGGQGVSLDLGRMSEILVDDSLFDGAATVAALPQDEAAIITDFEENPELLNTLPPSSSGGAYSVTEAGGSHHYTVAVAAGQEVSPDSGAETRGVLGYSANEDEGFHLTFLDPPGGEGQRLDTANPAIGSDNTSSVAPEPFVAEQSAVNIDLAASISQATVPDTAAPVNPVTPAPIDFAPRLAAAAVDLTDGAYESGKMSIDSPDGIKAIAFTTDSRQLSGLKSDGQNLVWRHETGSNIWTVVTEQDGKEILTVTVDGGGNYAVIQNQPLYSEHRGQDTSIITLPFIVTDDDGDAATANLAITVPMTEPPAPVLSAESVSASAVDAGGAGKFADAASFDLTSLVSSSGVVDDALTFRLAQLNGQDSGLKSNGETVFYKTENGVLTAYTENAAGEQATIFTFTVSASGETAFNMIGAIDHAQPTLDPSGMWVQAESPESQNLTIDLGQYVEVANAYGGATDFSGKIPVTIEDVAPSVDTGLRITGLSVGETVTRPFVTSAEAVSSARFYELDSGYADDMVSRFVSDGQTLHWLAGQDGRSWRLVTDTTGDDVLSIRIGEDGAFSTTLHQNMQDKNNPDASYEISLSLGFAVSDADGDLAQALSSGSVGISLSLNPPVVAADSLVGIAMDGGGAGKFSGQESYDLSALVTSTGIADQAMGFYLADLWQENSGLTSNGEIVYYQTRNTNQNSVLTAYTQDQSGQRHDVFTFTVSANGQTSFNMIGSLDQIDDPTTPENEGAAITVDLGQYVFVSNAGGGSANFAGRIPVTIADAAAAHVTDAGGEASFSGANSYDLASLAAAADLAAAGATFSLADMNGQDSGLKSNGETVFYKTENGVLTAYTENATGEQATIFTFTVSASGQTAFNMTGTLDHARPTMDPSGMWVQAESQESLSMIIDLGEYVRMTDASGTTVEFTGHIPITIDDVTPTADTSFRLDLTDGAVSEQPGFITSAEAFTVNFLNINYEEHGDISHYMSGGQALSWHQDEQKQNTWSIVREDGEQVFTFTIHGDGSVSAESLREMYDANPDNWGAPPEFSLEFQITDADGDQAVVMSSGSMVVDLPVAVTPPAPVLASDMATIDATDGGGALFNGDDNSADLSALFSGNGFAGEGKLDLTFRFKEIEGEESGLTSNGETIYYRATGETLTAYTQDESGNTQTIFTLTSEKSGQVAFNMTGTVDHIDNPHTEADEGQSLTIDLGQYIVATNAQGGSVTLDGHVPLTIHDATPTAGELTLSPSQAGAVNLDYTWHMDEVLANSPYTNYGQYHTADGTVYYEMYAITEWTQVGGHTWVEQGLPTGLTSNGREVLVINDDWHEESPYTHHIIGYVESEGGKRETVFTLSFDYYTDPRLVEEGGSGSVNGLVQLHVTGAIDLDASGQAMPFDIGQFFYVGNQDGLYTDPEGDSYGLEAGLFAPPIGDPWAGFVNADGALPVDSADAIVAAAFDIDDQQLAGLKACGQTLVWEHEEGSDTYRVVTSYDQTTVLTVTVSADGQYAARQSESIYLAAGSGATAQPTLTLPFTVTDQDGDQGAGNLHIALGLGQPSSPSLTDASAAITATDGGGQGEIDGAASYDLSALVKDDGGGISFQLAHLTDFKSGLTSNGAAVLYTTDGDTLTATADGETIFTLTVEADGTAVFSMVGALDHFKANDETLSGLDLGQFVQAVNADGGQTKLTGKILASIADSTPEVASDAAITLTATEPSVSEALATSADGVATIALQPSDDQLVNIRSEGLELFWKQSGDAWKIVNENDESVMTVILGKDGSVHIDQHRQIHYAEAGHEAENTATITIPFTVTDADGDSASNSFTLTAPVVEIPTPPQITGVVNQAITEDVLAPDGLIAAGQSILISTITAVDTDGAQQVIFSIDGDKTAILKGVNGEEIQLGVYRVESDGSLWLDMDAGLDEAAQAAVNAMHHGNSYQLSDVMVTISDGKDNTYLKAQPGVTGVNDRPELQNATAYGDEDVVLRGSLADTMSDADAGDKHTFAISGEIFFNEEKYSADELGLSLGKDGSYSVDTTKAIYQRLTEGQTGELQFSYTVRDSSGSATATSEAATMTIEIAGHAETLGEHDLTEAAVGGATPTNIALDLEKTVSHDNIVSVGFTVSDTNGEIAAGVDTLYLHYDGATGAATWSDLADGAVGHMAYDQTSGKINVAIYDQKDGAGHALPGDFSHEYQVTVTPNDGGGSAIEAVPLTLTINGSDDTAVFAERPFSHDNPNMVLTPYVVEGASNILTGSIAVSDVDDPSGSERFAIWNGKHGAASEYLQGVWDEASNTGVFTLDNSQITLSFSEEDGWRYEYESNAKANAGGGVINDIIKLRAYDPDVYDANDPATYSEKGFTATVVTAQPVDGGPKAVLDLLTVQAGADGAANVALSLNGLPIDDRGINVLDNDLTHTGADGAVWSGSSWQTNASMTLPQSVAAGGEKVYAGLYGNLIIAADGVARYELDPAKSANVRALLPTDDSLRDSFTYEIVENGKTVLGVMIVNIQGVNDSPSLALPKMSLNVSASWNPGYEHPEAGVIKGTVIDPDINDSHHFVFATKVDAASDSTLREVGEADGYGNMVLHVDKSLAQVLTTAENNTVNNYGLTNAAFDPDHNGQQGIQIDLIAKHIYEAPHGWLLDHGDGTFSFVVDRSNQQVMDLTSIDSSYLTDTFYVKAVDAAGAESAWSELSVTITGANDKPIVKPFGSDSNDFYGNMWRVDDAGEKVVFIGQNTATMASPGALDFTPGSLNNISYLYDNVYTPDSGGSVYLYKSATEASQGTIPIYARLGADGAMVGVGNLYLSQSYVYFYPSTNFGDLLKLRGEVSELFTDAAGTKPFTGVWAASAYSDQTTDISRAEHSFIPMNLKLVFADEAPTLYCDGKRVPTTDAAIDASGKIQFNDLEGEGLTLQVWDFTLNDWRTIEADNTKIATEHGSLRVDQDGSWRFNADTGATGLDNIRVRVLEQDDPRYAADTENQSTESVLSLEIGDYEGQSVVRLVDDIVGGTYAGNRNTMSINLLGNDQGAQNLHIMNAGVYEVYQQWITADGHSAQASVADGQVAKYLVSGAERFEFFVQEMNIAVNENGQGQVSEYIGSGYISGSQVYSAIVYDRETGSRFAINDQTAPGILSWIKNNITGNDATGDAAAREMLRVQLPYQVQDPATGEVLQANLVIDFSKILVNHSPTLYSTYTYYVGQYENLNYSVGQFSYDQDLGDIYGSQVSIGENPTVSNGKLVFDANHRQPLVTDGQANTLENYILQQGGSINYTTGIVTGPTDSTTGKTTTITLDVPVYRNVGGVAVEVGVVTYSITSLGGQVQIGVDVNGQPIMVGGGTTFGNSGVFTLHHADPDAPEDALLRQAISEITAAMRDSHENNSVAIGQTNITVLDPQGSGYNGYNNTVYWSGKDVLMGNGAGTQLAYNAPAPDFSVGTAEDVASQAVNIMGGTQHTASTNRVDASGWDHFIINGVEQAVSASGVTTWNGQYGVLKYDPSKAAAAQCFSYEHYDVATTKAELQEAREALALARQLGADNIDELATAVTALEAQLEAARLVVGLRGDSDPLMERFDYTLVDKNGESGSGAVTITVQGKDSAFTYDKNYTREMTEGQGLVAGSMGEVVANPDMGYISRYILTYGGVTYGESGGDVTIETEYGRLYFNADSGIWSFQDDGGLQAGETASLKISIELQLGHRENGIYLVDRESGTVDCRLELQGVNNAPTVFVGNQIVAGLDEAVRTAGAFSWTDVDNTAGFNLTASHDGQSGQVLNGVYTVAGGYGSLSFPMVGDGGASWEYAANAQAVAAAAALGDHRVADNFEVSVTDAGGATSSKTMTFYAVDGEHVTGTAGNDTLVGAADKANVIQGGAGDDVIDLSASLQDILVWDFDDIGTPEAPAHDTVMGFTVGLNQDADMMDLRGLLGSDSEKFSDLLSYRVEDGNTTISIKAGVDDEAASQEITLTGVELNAADSGHGTFDELKEQVRLIDVNDKEAEADDVAAAPALTESAATGPETPGLDTGHEQAAAGAAPGDSESSNGDKSDLEAAEPGAEGDAESGAESGDSAEDDKFGQDDLESAIGGNGFDEGGDAVTGGDSALPDHDDLNSLIGGNTENGAA
ncbi:MAG: VCBS domain-containing protein [Desulfobulbaceae bacterium]|jgi:VCBS repeat-containing protein|nr:VCBS domain-containing protein [Desulfobulbaceae bacterium]